jgi:hypothetical protein
MNTNKILAPKPVRQLSSLTGDKQNISLFKPLNLINLKRSISWHGEDTKAFLRKNNSLMNLASIDNEDIEQELHHNEVKNEILSILCKSDSTCFKSFDFDSECEMYNNNCLKFDFSGAEEAELGMPVRCNNPLIKNFSDELVDLSKIGPGCRLFEYGLSNFFEK